MKAAFVIFLCFVVSLIVVFSKSRLLFLKLILLIHICSVPVIMMWLTAVVYIVLLIVKTSLNMITVKPLMFMCPLFCYFRKSIEITKFEGATLRYLKNSTPLKNRLWFIKLAKIKVAKITLVYNHKFFGAAK